MKSYERGSSNVIFLFLFLEGIPFIILYKNPKVN